MPSILIDLGAEFDDGTSVDVVADQRDVARWEIQDFGCPFADIDSRSMLGLRWLAWHAAHRQQKTGLSWDDWDRTCVEVVSRDEADPQVPAGGGPNPGTKAPSAGI